MTKQQLAVLQEAASTMQHALIFIQTKEKMYSVGVELYERALADLHRLVESLKLEPAPNTAGPDELSRLKASICEGPDGPDTALVFAGFSGRDEIDLFMKTLVNNGTFLPPPKVLQ